MCPECKQATLHPTGAFWTCANCGFAITEQALMLEQGESADKNPAQASGAAAGASSDAPARLRQRRPSRSR